MKRKGLTHAPAVVLAALLMGGTAGAAARESEAAEKGEWKLEAEATDKYWGCGLCQGEDLCLDTWSGGLGAQLCYPHSFVDFMPVPKGKTLIIGYANGGGWFAGSPSHSVSVSINGEKLINPDSANPVKWERHKYWWPLEDTLRGERAIDVSAYLTMDTNWVRIEREHVHLIVIDYIKVSNADVAVAGRGAPPKPRSLSAWIQGSRLVIRGAQLRHATIEFLDPAGRTIAVVPDAVFRRGTCGIPRSVLETPGLRLIRLRPGGGRSELRSVLHLGTK